jgi:hypothetical protein
MNNWPNHWLLNEDHRVFRSALAALVDQAAAELADPRARRYLGGEDTQCQHFFTKLYTLMQTHQAELTQSLLCCSRVKDPVIELRYYRSVPRRSRKRGGPQLVETETGADFAFTLQVAVPDEIRADRSVLGQAKLVDDESVPIPIQQLNSLLEFAGPMSGVYLLWGPRQSPAVITVDNIKTLARTKGTNRLRPDVLRYGKPFAEFLVDMFLGLWFGKDFVRDEIRKRIPTNSPTALYVMLHMGVPPPNVIHFDISSSRGRDRPPGVYIQEINDLNRQ